VNDYKGAKAVGMQAVHYDPAAPVADTANRVLRLTKLLENLSRSG
jgi:hypothetical protein